MKREIFILMWAVLSAAVVFSQNVVTATLINPQNKPLANVHIFIRGSGKGVTSNQNGLFRLNISQRRGILEIKTLGYKTKVVGFSVKGVETNLGNIILEPETYSLNEITISSGLVQSRKTPVSITEINARTISNELADQPLPFALNADPAVFTVRNGGGSGDALLSIRGFKQENVALLLDGIPINGEENGLVYWSNWLGLNDVAAEIQIQKGPGFANLASNAVGGSINIITMSAGKIKRGSFSMQTTDYGNMKVNLSLSSGKLKNGWQFATAISAFVGRGYIDATSEKGFSYFFAATKKLNRKNTLSITLLGAPQYHNQRTLKLSAAEVKRYGYRYNKDWGWYNGKIKNASANFYHKPFLIVNHDITINSKQKLSNTAYLSVGAGGGKWSERFNYAPSIFQYRTELGQIDWKTIYYNNENNTETYILSDGNTVTGYSKNVGTYYLASHIETGFMSTYERQINAHIVLTGGVHYRYFNSFLREEISNLMGGKFFVEDYAWSLAGIAGRPQIKTVGDIIKVNNHTLINLINMYTRLQYKSKKIITFLSLKGSNNWYQRIDNYNYIVNTKSQVISKSGFDFRGGISYAINGDNNIFYFNAAYISKVPYFKYVFGNFTNVPVQNLHNESIRNFEGGYRFGDRFLNFEINGFYSFWHNVSMLTNEYVQLENNSSSRAMINGLDALHKGIEAKIIWKPKPALNFTGFVSIGDYRWKNDVSATLINNDNVVTDTVFVYAKNLFVGGTAQQKYGIIADMHFFRWLNLKTEYMYFNKLYADFDPVNRNNPATGGQAFEFPSYGLFNVYLGISFKLFSGQMLFQVNGYNLFNTHYIETGQDGAAHNAETFRGFWSFGRNLNFMLKVYF